MRTQRGWKEFQPRFFIYDLRFTIYAARDGRDVADPIRTFARFRAQRLDGTVTSRGTAELWRLERQTLDNAHADAIMRIMKIRKNITLSRQAILRGELAAKKRGASLSALVEKHLLSLADDADESDNYCSHHKPVPRPGDARYQYLIRKHR